MLLFFLPFCGTFAQDGVVEMSRPCQWNAGAGVYHLLRADCQMFQTSQYLVVKHNHYLTLRAQFSSVVSLQLHGLPGFPVRHQLLEFTQTHVHRVGDDIQPSHPLLSPSPPAFNLSQHQDLFQ